MESRRPSESCPRCGKTLTLWNEIESGDSYWLCLKGLGGCGRRFGVAVGTVVGIDWEVDPSVPVGEVHLRDKDGRTLARIVNVKSET